MIYAVSCPDPNRDRIDKIISLFRYQYPIHLEENPTTLFISAPITAKEIYDKIAAKEGEGASILILGIRTYYGWASPQLWEWLDVQFKA